MTSNTAILGDYQFFDLKPARRDMHQEIVAGLRKQEKRIAPKYFYDDEGSALFESITELPEYYLTRTEMTVFDRYREDLAAVIGGGTCLVEYGSGSSQKIRKLLETGRPEAYMPVDISKDHLQNNARALHRDFPGLSVYPICADFTQPFELPEVANGWNRVGFFPGSSIGNFDPADAVTFLTHIARNLGCGAQLIIGVDRKKATDILEAAYDDSQGVTAKFNLNLLKHLNAELGADFVVDEFAHEAVYNEDLGCVQMYLRSRKAQQVSVGTETVEFARNETIHTENCYKYHVEEFQALAEAAGFAIRSIWTDERDWFAVVLLEVQ
ncbi:MAG: L-histidine N(alpha)-methyltransferase [Gammaproteobacteria bacterium]|nr:L-histidine N(alpha)-methyltransferase [Gammaproteobacteria bacterium]